MDIHHRFKGDLSYTDKALSITIIGIGGIGSWTCNILSSVGKFVFYIYELPNHLVEESNVGTQWYSRDDISKAKDIAIKSNMQNWGTPMCINSLGKYEKGSGTTPIVFCGPDNIDVRRDVFEDWYTDYKDNPDAIYIDGRLALFHGYIYTVTGNSPILADRYRATLFPKSEAAEPSCTQKQSKAGAFRIASEMCGVFANFIFNKNMEMDIRSIPFSIHFDMKSHIYDTKE